MSSPGKIQVVSATDLRANYEKAQSQYSWRMRGLFVVDMPVHVVQKSLKRFHATLDKNDDQHDLQTRLCDLLQVAQYEENSRSHFMQTPTRKVTADEPQGGEVDLAHDSIAQYLSDVARSRGIVTKELEDAVIRTQVTDFLVNEGGSLSTTTVEESADTLARTILFGNTAGGL